jgi:hypothetical protein
LAAGTVESTRLALHSFPTSPNNPVQELMGRNLMAHIRSNIFARVNRTAIDPGNTLPNAVQVAALLVRGSTPLGRFHIQVTASADPFGNSDNLLFAMIPDIDLLDAILANQTAGSFSLGLRGVSQLFGDKSTSVPNAGWNSCVYKARNAGRHVRCCTALNPTRESAATTWQKQFGGKLVPPGSVV